MYFSVWLLTQRNNIKDDCKIKAHIKIIREPTQLQNFDSYIHEIVLGIFLIYCIRILEKFLFW